MSRWISNEQIITEPAIAADLDPLVGQVLDGRFRIVDAVGKGGMGRVYRAVQMPLNRAVALKVLDYNFGAGRDESFRQRFLVEAALTAKLSHPNTVTVIDYGCTESGIFYIAMEYLDGSTLHEVLAKEKALSWRRVLNLGQQVARSLREAHQLGVVHRDLKPANVIVLNADADTDQIKVLDFGLVKSFVVGHELEGRAITQRGMLMGSPPYMAPEQGEQGQADPRSDIYSLGTVLYEALTGRVPFDGRAPMEVILKHVHEPVPAMKAPEGYEPIPAAMEAIVLRCLAKSPVDRFASMDEVLQAFSELAQPTRHITQETELAFKAVRDGQRRSRVKTALFFLAALAAGAVATALLMPTVKPSAPAAEARPALQAPPAEPAKTTPETALVAREAEAATPQAAPGDDAVPAHAEAAAPVLPPAPNRPTVTFHIESDPAGATVTMEGFELGQTPVDFELPEGSTGNTRAELKLALAGYLPLTVTAAGQGPRIEVRQKLARVSAVAAPAPAPKRAKPAHPVAAPKARSTAKLDEGDDEATGTKKPSASELKRPSSL